MGGLEAPPKTSRRWSRLRSGNKEILAADGGGWPRKIAVEAQQRTLAAEGQGTLRVAGSWLRSGREHCLGVATLET